MLVHKAECIVVWLLLWSCCWCGLGLLVHEAKGSVLLLGSCRLLGLSWLASHAQATEHVVICLRWLLWLSGLWLLRLTSHVKTPEHVVVGLLGLNLWLGLRLLVVCHECEATSLSWLS